MTNTEFKTRFLPLHKELYRVAVRMLGDSCEAEDAVQNLYLKLWERRDTLGNIENDRAYCQQLLKNICIDRWREIQRHEQQRLDEERADICGETNNEGENSDKLKHLRAFLAQLHERQRRIFLLRLRGSTYDEMEQQTGQSATSLRQTVSRLKREFINSYKQQNR
jgi:RNA polymerase sigma-70 factor (ECF subfamily)